MGVNELSNSNADDMLIRMWPLAYADLSKGIYVDLKDHLVRTAHAVVRLFANRIRYLSWVCKHLEDLLGPVEALAFLVGLLHDLGKASTYYLNNYLGRSSKDRLPKITFGLHEHIASLLLSSIGYKVLDSTSTYDIDVLKVSRACIVLARVIARHHAAMPNRHPRVLLDREGQCVKELTQAVEGICSHKVYDLLEKLGNECERLYSKHSSGFCKKLVVNVKEHLKNICEDECRMDPYCWKKYLVNYKALTGFKLQDYQNLLYDSYRLTISLAGFLIVADNLVASYCENRASDDRATPAFIEDWRRELQVKLDELKRDDQLFCGCVW